MSEGFAGLNLLSQLVYYRTYAKTKPTGFKESYEECVDRVMNMHLDKFPDLVDPIVSAFSFVRQGVVVPSMRTMQFAGDPILRESARAYNCCYTPIDGFKCFADLFYLLMCGCGVGYSVQWHHIRNLPPIMGGASGDFFVIEDTKEGWSDSILRLIENPFVEFVYGKIRKAGSLLSTGGTASGSEPLRRSHEFVRKILKNALGRQLSSLEVHDIICHISDAVVVGGVRRAALISLFDPDDSDMLDCKAGEWWKNNPQRARANNSAVIHRQDPFGLDKFYSIFLKMIKSGAGEPGVVWTNDYDWGLNPCAEISLKSFCNLSEINVSRCMSPEKFYEAARHATLIGKLQSTYTDFNYISPRWKKNAEEEMLLGVSLTGQAENWSLLSPMVLREGARQCLMQDLVVSQILGVGEAHRIGTSKPSGSTSLVLSTTSGIHAAHAAAYLRRVRVDITDPIAKYLISKFGVGEAETGHVVEYDRFASNNVVVTVPVKKSGAITRDSETAVSLMNRSRHIYENWIKPSHRKGPNTHNVSLTVNYREEELGSVIRWMSENKDDYAGISLLPFNGGSYTQMPFETIEDKTYSEWVEKFRGIEVDFNEINFYGQADKRREELACAGGSCEII